MLTNFTASNFSNPIEAARAWADAQEAQQKAQHATIGSDHVASYEHSLTSFAQCLEGVDSTKIEEDLLAHNYLYFRQGDYWVYHRYSRLFELGLNDTDETIDIFPTAAGRACILEMYLAGRLTMKKGSAPVPRKLRPR